VAILVVLAIALLGAAPAAAKPWIAVRGGELADHSGHTVRLLGVNRSGTEYSCQQGYGFFDGPSDAASIRAMKAWHINAVRVPLNETCWLGINGIDPKYGGANYRRTIRSWVSRLEAAGLYVILDLHWAGPGSTQATGIIPMPDADHAPDFWRSVAAEYKGDHAVLFDLYNEPHDVDWACWQNGCEIDDQRVGSYRAAGMTELVEAVRSTGAKQPVMLGGTEWARNDDGWLAYLPPDPADAEVASNHTYNFAACYGACRAALAKISRTHPVVTGEMGEGDCRTAYIEPYMNWADAHGISYLGWAWDTHGGWTCKSGPSLIKDYEGTPTAFGRGFRDHLRQLAAG
jgi:endoglucanase